MTLCYRRRDSKAPWLDKYGPPMRTNYRVTIENLSTRVSWQVSMETLSDNGVMGCDDINCEADNVLTNYYLTSMNPAGLRDESPM